MKIKQSGNYWYLLLICMLPLLSAALLYLDTIMHHEFIVHLAAIPIEILFGAIIVERFLASKEKRRRIRHWSFIKSCIMRSKLHGIIIANFSGMERPELALEQIRTASAKELQAMLPQLKSIHYSSLEAMDKVVDEYVAAYQTFYNLMEWAISNDFEDIFHDMIFVLHFIHDVESFHLRNPGKSFVKTIQKNPEKFTKVKKVLTDGIIKFVEYAIELKQTQPDVFYTLINDIIAKSDYYKLDQKAKNEKVTSTSTNDN